MIFYKQLAVLVTTFVTLFSSVNTVQGEISETNDKSDLSLKEWSQGNRDFTTTFYPYAREGKFNFVFSPLSLQMGIAMTSELTYGETQKQLINMVALPEEAMNRQNGSKNILKLLNTGMAIGVEPVSLLFSNSSWVSSEVVFRQDLANILADSYQATLNTVDFKHSSDAAREEINAWVDENTQSKIQNFLPAGSLNSQTKLVLVNTFFMRAPWQESFDPAMTYEDVFYGIEKSFQSTQYMKKKKKFNVLKEDFYTVIEIPFKQAVSTEAQLALYVVLPDEETSLQELEDFFTPDLLAHWIGHVRPKVVTLSVPKFKISSSINVKAIFQKMGWFLPFSPKAEFDLEGKNSRLVISDIFHNATFEVDEWGGTGSAATGVVISPTSYQPPENIVVNRPFLVVVAEKTSGIILFAGHVYQPKN